LKTHSISKRGIALAITMLVLGVMTIISVAFFQAYHSHFSITRSSRASETAAAACEAAGDYVTYRLEHDRDWGSQEFTDADKEKDPASPFIEIESLVGTHEFEGRLPDSGATIKGTIYNNMGPVPVGDPGFPPPETARCEIECKSGDSTRRVEFLVRRAPIFDSSALTKADLKIAAESLTLRSKDNSRNMLRSEHDIYVPDMLNGSGRTKFFKPKNNPADPDVADHNGLFWAKGDIYSYDAAGTAEMVNEADELSTAQQTTNGKLAPNSGSHVSIFDDVTEDLMKSPGSHASIPVDQGRWTFSKRPATVTFTAVYSIRDEDHSETATFAPEGQIYVDVLEYYADPDSDVPTKVYRGKERAEDLEAFVPPVIEVDGDDGLFDWSDTGDFTPGTIETTSAVVDIPGYSGNVELLDHNKLFFTDDGMMSSFDLELPTTEASFYFDLQSQEVSATHDAQVEVNGPFHVTSQEHDVPVDPPRLLLGYEEAPSVDGGVSKAVIKAQGTIDIKNGITEGLGSLISVNGDVKIQPTNTDTVDIDSGLDGSGLLIYAGRDVELRSPAETEDWTLKGLVFARGGIRLTGMTLDDEGNEVVSGTPDARFEGSLVALGETAGSAYNGIEFDTCKDIEFVYDSDMLEAYVAHLAGERIQVETVYWRD
jgi:hypothetical protein